MEDVDRPRALDDMPPRRRFLLASASTVALAGATAAAGRFLQTRNGAAADRAALVLPRPKKALPPIPRSVALDPAGVSPFTTPNRDFYRIDINLLVPQVKTDGYELTVKGMVDRELTIPWDDLVARDLSEYDITLTCVSNQVGDRLIGNARWLGFPLRELLDEAGVDRRADQIVGRSSDGYTGGFPLEAAYDRDAIVAIGMNGEPLPLSHGFPVRLVTPGIYGYLSAVKWLTEIEVTTFDAFDSYWVPRGYAEKAPIRTMSRIDTPRSLSQGPRRQGDARRHGVGADPRHRAGGGAHRRRRVAARRAVRGPQHQHLAPVDPRLGRHRAGAAHDRGAGHRRRRRDPARGAARSAPRRRHRLAHDPR